jgi:hypothetical protein
VRRSQSRAATEKRWDKAIDRVLNSGLMLPYMEDLWKYVDGQITYKQFCQRMSP